MLKKLTGYRSYAFACLMILVGLYMLLFVNAEAEAVYISGQNIVKTIVSYLLILLGFTLIFIRLAIKQVEYNQARILAGQDEIKAMLREAGQ